MVKVSKIQQHFRLGHYMHLIKLLKRGLIVGGTEISTMWQGEKMEGEGMMRQWKYLEITLVN